MIADRDRLRILGLDIAAEQIRIAKENAASAGLTDAFGWHWVFFINLPIGAIALTFIWLRMPPLKPVLASRPTIDVLGAVLLAIAVVPFLVALTLGRPELRPGEHGHLWTDWQVLGSFGVSLLGLISFVFWLANLGSKKDWEPKPSSNDLGAAS